VADLTIEFPTPGPSDDAVRHVVEYEGAVEDLGQKLCPSDQALVLKALLTRDRIGARLEKGALSDSTLVNHIGAVDKRLKGHSSSICAVIGTDVFDDWRQTLRPPDNAWWWFLDHVVETRSASSILVLFLGLGFFSLLVALITDLLRRFLAGGPDAASLTYLIFQTLVAVATGAAFTEAGAQWIDGFLSGLRVSRSRAKQWRTLALFASVVVVTIVWTRLDAIAVLYDRSGAQLAATGQVTTAIHRFERSIALSPDYAAAHYNLANAYEDVGESDKALVEYQIALRADAEFVPAYNNAARLLIRKKEYGTALQLVDIALSKPAAEKRIKYSLWKNRGAAHLALDNPIQSQDDLREALRNQNGAEANCLMAQIIQRKGGNAELYWRSCLSSSADGEKPDAVLTSLAEEHLRAKEQEKAAK
jgi:Tfp pilus assembly protein PilF